MLINELPDDCLLAVFDQINYLDDLINCYKVCVRWNYLIPERTKKVKYLIVQGGDYEVRGYSSDCVYYKEADEVYGTCLSKLFPNLIIFEFCTLRCPDREFCKCIVSFVRNQGTLKGLIHSYSDPMEEYCETLEMLSTSSKQPRISNGSRMKQLETGGQDSLEAVQRYSHDFPNLEMLQTSIVNNDHRDRLRVPLFEKLKILALYSDDTRGIFYGFQLMDSCPSLQSAHICIQADRFFVDETLKHECLQDLAIEFCNGEQINWNDLKRLLMKYPNLRHLRLQGLNMKHGQIKQLVHILSNLVLLDVRECHKVTQKTADYVQNYCKRNGRSIKFYFDGNPDSIKADWPQSSNKEIQFVAFSRGFDFMKHCFFANIFSIPRFLIPIDY